MGDNQVTIDPEFDPHNDRGRGPRVVWLPVAGLVVAVGLFGWLFGFPAAPESDESEAAASTSTAPDTVAATSVSVPPDTLATTTTVPTIVTETSAVPTYLPLAILRLPLSDVVSGFTDRITMVATPMESYKVMRWAPSETVTRVVLEVERDEFDEGSDWSVAGWPVGFDASGDWFAHVQSDGALAVSVVSENREEPVETITVGTHVSSAVWHDTVPGRLAWISCTGSASEPATLYSLQVGDPTAEPVPARTMDKACLGWGDGAWLQEWSDEDPRIESESWDALDPVFVDAEGAEATTVPGLADGESVGSYVRSPDRTLVALTPEAPWDIDPSASWDARTSRLRVMDAATGGILAEVSEYGSEVFTMTWSTDSRYLLYELWNFNTESGALMFYDTLTTTTIRIPLSEIIDDIQTTSPN